MSDARIIKKYPNRRLYDTAISHYITLAEVRELVRDYVPFRVIDSRSGEDLTRATLLQIIAEDEERGEPVFSTDLLSHTIRSYGDATQAMMARFLEHSLRQFTQQQSQFHSPLTSLIGAEKRPTLQELTTQNLEAWKEVIDEA